MIRTVALAVCLSASSGLARADELTIFTSRAVATVLEKVGPHYEKNSGNKLKVEVDLSPIFVRRINGGEAFDVFVSLPNVIDNLTKGGKLIPDTQVKLVKSGTGVEIKAGSKKPDISTVEAFKRALLDARSVGYLPTSGVPELVDRLGIGAEIKPKAFVPTSDVVSEKVAAGEVELGVVVITQILTTHGVELVSPLPSEIQINVLFDGAISAQSKNRKAAENLLSFLKGSDAIAIIRSQGMEPG